jgi:NTP pyrophosphatase (non-canonical NTP hydrolase)
MDGKFEKGKVYRFKGMVNWSLVNSFEPCDAIINDVVEFHDKLKERKENDAVEKFFAEITKPVHDDMVDALCYARYVKPGFFCDNEGTLHARISNIGVDVGKEEPKPWKPQYNEKVLYQFNRLGNFTEGIFLCMNPNSCQEKPKKYVVIGTCDTIVKAYNVKPFRDQGTINNDIANTVATMKEKLEENSHKGYWGDADFDTLFKLLMEESYELEKELDVGDTNYHPNYKKVMREAADVCNYGMMIHSIAKRGLEKKS